MADIKNREITSRDDDFARWYTDVITKAELIDYGTVRGCMILRPYGYAIWELIQAQLDKKFKDTGHENVYMPMFIPESLLQKEKDHVAGFAPEVAWVTHGGSEKLQERLCVRPTSETLFCDHYKNIIQSHRDLPKLYNQWCSVVRWEKTTRPFLRTMEFLWQEGHTAHATAEESVAETLRMLDVYADFLKEVLAIQVLKGQKTESEKFAGALQTYTIESIMHDGKALQAGTSHNFGDGFAKAFDIKYTDKENKLQYVHQTSWGMTTRLIGALIMVHSDDNGLVLPPLVAPLQVVIIPVASHKPGVIEKCDEILAKLSLVSRVKIDKSDKSPGWKFAEHEMKGVPLRIELGPKDIEAGKCVVVRRDTAEKFVVPLDEIVQFSTELLKQIQAEMLERSRASLENRTNSATNIEEFERILSENGGLIKAMWCGSENCEDGIKERTTATSRCIPFQQEKISENCIYCGESAKTMVVWGKAY